MPLTTGRSEAIFARAQKILPGGVNSPVRAFRAVGGHPRVIARGKGARVWDVDDNPYLDFVGSWGPLIVGHAHPGVVAAIQEAAGRGTSYGAPTEAEVHLAGLVQDAFPSIEMVRFTSSGTEATMAAVRLARGYTHRDLILKFDGGYHGHSDGMLVQAGSGVLTLGQPDSAGVPAATARLTLSVPYNDVAAVETAFGIHSGEVAAVIVEPVAGNMGVIPPAPGFLQHLRSLTQDKGALLIFDEVITGFRVSAGGAQALYGVHPDLTCLGKILGGGLPVGALGGRRDVMELLAPLGAVYQAGTLSGNPLAMAAGIATLTLLREDGVYQHLEALAQRMEQVLLQAAVAASVPFEVNRVGSMLTGFFRSGAVTDYASARESDTQRYAAYFRAMLEGGIYLPPSQFEASFLSLAHTREDVEAAGDVALAAVRAIASSN